MPGSIKKFWPQILDAFDGVDYILHGGDLYTRGVIDQLNELAPIYVAEGNGDIGVQDERLRSTWVLDLGGISIAMIHEFPTPRRKTPEFIAEFMKRTFPDASPDVLIYGHTHLDEMHQVDSLLCVNPGSPTLPRNQSVRFGTLGFLDIDDGSVEASLYQLNETGIERIDAKAFDH